MSLIASRFQVGGIPVRTVIDNEYVMKQNCLGQAIYDKQQIVIDLLHAPRETTEQAFFHELVHWILFVQNRHALREDEEFIDGFAHLLYQALQSGGYHCHTVTSFQTQEAPKDASGEEKTP